MRSALAVTASGYLALGKETMHVRIVLNVEWVNLLFATPDHICDP